MSENIDERIKVTMLGSSAAGKTCYMVAMYKMMNYGIDLNGFVLSANDIDDNVLFGELWSTMKDKGSDRWPAPTTEEVSAYDLNFYFSNAPILGFDWFDYRGGALKDYKNASDLKMLRERLLDTSCLLLCVSGEHLKNGLSLDSYEGIEVSGINQLLTDTQSLSRRNVPPAVVIVLTKSDLCKDREPGELLSDIKKLFSPLFASGARWLVMVCPVTLGPTLAEDAEQGSINPKNVHIPVVFSLFAELYKQQWKLEGMHEENSRELEKASSNFIASLMNRKEIKEKEEANSDLLQRLAVIRKSIRMIYKNINMKDDVDVFFNGKKIKFHEFFR